MKHRVPSAKEAGYREPDGVNPDVQIACTACGLFGVKDGEEGCDFWAESPTTQCPKRYSGVQCSRTLGHKGGCERQLVDGKGGWVGSRCLCRASYFDPPGTIAPDAAN